MKKLIFILAMLPFGAFAQNGAIHQNQSFLNGQGLFVTNNATITNNQVTVSGVGGQGVGLFYISPSLVQLQSGYTNGLVLTTNGSTVYTNFSFVSPNWAQNVNGFANVNGDVGTPNVTLAALVNYTNVFLGPNQNFYPTNAATGTYIAAGVSNTNTVTLTFVRQVDSRFGDSYLSYGTTTADTFTWVFAAPAAPGGVVTTNVPASFFTGTRRVMLKTVGASTASNSQGIILNDVSLSGFGTIQ